MPFLAPQLDADPATSSGETLARELVNPANDPRDVQIGDFTKESIESTSNAEIDNRMTEIQHDAVVALESAVEKKQKSEAQLETLDESLTNATVAQVQLQVDVDTIGQELQERQVTTERLLEIVQIMSQALKLPDGFLDVKHHEAINIFGPIKSMWFADVGILEIQQKLTPIKLIMCNYQITFLKWESVLPRL